MTEESEALRSEALEGAPVSAGDLLANGRYRVESILGEGGMGVVCAATHVALGQQVAIKFLLPEALEHPQAVARFEREARASASMTSEHVVRVTDVGRLETGAPYFVMEFLEGEDLAQRLRRTGPLEVRAAIALFAQACEGLIEAHAKGLVHRDIKPSNLFLAKRASGKAVLKVIDFGIAKAELAGESQSHDLTRTSEIMGSPQYMSPEQLRDTKNVDGRTDIWSLGASFFECLTGVPPFTGDSMPDLLVKISVEPPKDIRELRPDLPEALTAVIVRCLAKRPADRFASASELLEAIDAVRGSVSAMAVSFTNTGSVVRVADQSGSFIAYDATTGPTAATSGPVVASQQVGGASSESPRQSRIGFLAVAAFVVVAAAGSFLTKSRSSAPTPAKSVTESASVESPSASPASAAAPAPAAVAAAVPVAAEATASPVADAGGTPKVLPKAAVSRVTASAAAPAPVQAPAAPTAKDVEKKRKYDPGFE